MTQKFIRALISVAVMTMTSAYADMSADSFFSAGGSSFGSNNSTAATTVTANESTNNGTPVITMPQQIPQPTPSATPAPKIQYMQPATQLGKVAATAAPTTTFGNSNRGAAVTSTSPVANVDFTGLQSQGGAGGNDALTLIAKNTGSSGSTVNTNTADLLNYFVTDYSRDIFVPQTSGYISAAAILSAEADAQTKKQGFSGTLPDLTLQPPRIERPDASQQSANGDDASNSLQNMEYNNANKPENAVPFLGSITANSSGSEFSYWTPAARNAILNISLAQPTMDDLHKAVNAPFTSDWVNTIKTASDPQLLRTLVVEQAVQNALLYQSLQRQQDQELMQASELRMLQEMITSNTAAISAAMKATTKASDAQLLQQQRMVRSLQALTNQSH